MNLRDYQQELSDAIDAAWASGHRNVLAVAPTGAGKTVLFSHKIREQAGPCVAIAHRQELVTQISKALSRERVKHRIIGPSSVVRVAVKEQTEELGYSSFDPRATVAVAGVDTLIRRGDTLRDWAATVKLWVQDECHHVLRDNKWGKVTEFFPNARGLGVTATPLRADGNGLGRHADGLFDCMVESATMRTLIERGFLTPYRVFVPPSDLDLANVETGGTGDYKQAQLATAVHKSHIVGDVVNHYLRIARGKLGVTFAVDVAHAHEIAEQFNAAGVPASVVSAKSTDQERISTLRRFRSREILQLVNVDLFGEGFDLPAIEVVSMARPTASYALYSQQFGRALRLLDSKTHAFVIDHVGNALRHGLPDAPREWSLDRRERRSSSKEDPDTVKLRSCLECFGVYERLLKVCPYCGAVHVPAQRAHPEHVDGDLTELDPETLARLRGDADRFHLSPHAVAAEAANRYVPKLGQLAAANRHRAWQEAQRELRDSIAVWAGWQRAAGRDDSESYRRFYLSYGVDVLTAQGLGVDEAKNLKNRIDEQVNGFRVRGA